MTHGGRSGPGRAAAGDGARSPVPDRAVPALAVAAVLVHVLVNALSPYGAHRDELLYLAMGRHLRLFRMDFPPMIALVANAERLLGDSLVVVRIVPALIHGLLILLAARFAALLGGGRYARLLAGAAVALSPVFLRSGALFQPVVFDQLWWTLGLLLLLNIGRAGSDAGAARRGWIAYGAVCGLGLLTKFSILIFGSASLVAILLTPLRRWLATPWAWIAAGMVVLIGAPSLAGQISLHFPVMGQIRDLSAVQLERVGPADFLAGQLLMVGLGAVLALAGVIRLLRGSDAGGRAVAWTAITCVLLLLVLRGKAYYAAPIYPALFGAGAAALSAWSAGRHGARRLAVRSAAVVLLVGPALLTLPFGLPILPPPLMARYAAGLGVAEGTRANWGEVLELPQDYADMLPWEGQAAAVGRAYAALSPADRAQVVIAASNYGEAGALDFYGPRWGLPPAIAPVGSYWYFGPGDRPGNVVLKLGGDLKDIEPLFRSCEIAGYADSRWAVPEERHAAVFLCRGPSQPVQALWSRWEGNN